MIVKLVLASLLIGLCLGDNNRTQITFPEDDPICIKIDFFSNNSLKWNSEETPYWDFSKISIIDEESMCANGTDKAKLKIRFHADNATYTFTFTNNKGSFKIDMELEFIPDKVFKNKITDPVLIQTSIDGTFKENMSYACNSEIKYMKEKKVAQDTYELTMRFMDVQMQAFHLDNDQFSEAEHCANDEQTTPMSTETTTVPTETTTIPTETTTMPTETTTIPTETTTMNTETTPVTTEPLTTPETTMTTTPGGTTSAPNSHPSFDLMVTNDDNSSCIHLKAEMLLKVDYTKTDKTNVTVDIGVQSPTVTGSCNVTMGQWIRLEFMKDFSILILFGEDDSKNIYWETVNVTGVYAAELFPDAQDMNKTFSSTTGPLSDKFKAKNDGSYVCNAETTSAVGDSVKLETWNMQYTAYQQDATKFSDDDVSECSADSKTSSIVPIAVGAALAGLVVIVLIAYLVGRRRNRKGYDDL